MSIYPSWLQVTIGSGEPCIPGGAKIVDGIQINVFTNEILCSIVEDNLSVTLEEDTLKVEILNV